MESEGERASKMEGFLPYCEETSETAAYVEEHSPLHGLSATRKVVFESVISNPAKFMTLSTEVLPANGDETLNYLLSAVEHSHLDDQALLSPRLRGASHPCYRQERRRRYHLLTKSN